MYKKMEPLKEDKAKPRSDSDSNIYGVTIRPTLKSNIQAVAEDNNLLYDILDQIKNKYKLETIHDPVIEKGNHLHTTLRGPKGLRYTDIMKSFKGWHIYFKIKKDTDLKVWEYYLKKEQIDLSEYAFID